MVRQAIKMIVAVGLAAASVPAALAPAALRHGIPEAWLVGGIHDGRAGVSIYGLDTETVLRANPGMPYLSSEMMGGKIRTWERAATAANGVVVIEPKTTHSYGWSRGTGYAQLYLYAEQPVTAVLHLRQSGIETSGWLDGQPLPFAADPAPPADFPKPGDRPQAPLEGLTTEGLRMTAMPEKAEPAQTVTLELAPGWHNLLVKMVMQHAAGEAFFFAAKFTAAAGQPLDSLRTQVTDPTADLELQARAARFRPLIFVDAPANLPRPGEPLRIHADMDWHPIREEKQLATPIAPFPAILRLTLTDFAGQPLAVREVEGTFPATVTVDFGPAPEAGYYAVYPSLHTPDERLIMAWYADGFTVARGTAAQRERLEKKKLWLNNYYIFADNQKGGGFRTPGEDFTWLERSGVFKNFGAEARLDAEMLADFKAAHQRGLVLFADFSRDEPHLNDSPAEAQALAAAVAPFTRFFKGTNEIDIRHGQAAFDTLREPRHWVKRAEWEHAAAHRARPDAIYLGGSVVRPGDMRPAKRSGILGPGQWFLECLKLGLDKHYDAWDVHAYPQKPPTFGGPFGNSSVEDERGLNLAYEQLGRKNTLPFWLGEVGAKAAHCATGRRGQADLAAKMIAWVNHRSDYHGIAFCIGYEYDWARGRLWDYSMGHKPGEAAMITAGALIDGLPYRAVATQDKNLQAAWFGNTFMAWRTDDRPGEWILPLDGTQEWLLVDVVGRAKPLAVQDGRAIFPIGPSPVYVLAKAEYERLTRWE
ncbi:MAG: hypothetical protein WC789_11700 [Lentisphaeria bacterium]|jgi:hypothetical protein